ncbi:MAG: lipoprotein-releasing system ATP-binding protein LolD [Candidatus Marinimicrobia bacterium]|nr:lipoprotein-releasing system ATP-binding protein LolD [Candidatus Neomarinimicrobiota bacterium]|tara:strand:+ start:10283 stop:10966 length:684 start_codon:yes stop_codon:yes gene_type:complete
MILKAEKIKKSYSTSGELLQILKGLDFQISKGEMISITGPSGCGKSTLLNILGTLDSPDSGSLEICGKKVFSLDDNSISKLRMEKIGFVFQFHHLLPEFTVLENLMIPQRLMKVNEKKAKDRSLELLDKVGLSFRANHRPATISGGERQRVAVLRALANSPSIVLADEPTGNLDLESASHLMDMIASLADTFDKAFVIATHNPSVAMICKKNLEISNGLLKNISKVS